jgi:hypothetical protein
MGMSLNKMIQTALLGAENGAMEKIAQEAGVNCDACGKAAPPNSKLCRECAEKASRREEAQAGGEEQEKTSAAHVEKLAAAVEYLVQNFGSVQRPVGRVKMAQEPAVTTTPDDVGPGSGATSLPTNLKSPTPGMMPENFGEAKKNKPPMKPPLESGNQPTAAGNAMQTDHDSPPGGTAPYPETGVMKAGSIGRVGRIKAAMLRKVGADAESPASVSGKKTQSITGPENQPSTAVRPAEVTSQEKMIAGNEAAIGATKRQAKEVPKRRMGEVLSEPMQTSSTDSALSQALGSDVVSKGGAKVASANLSTLQKIASQGCQCKAQQLEEGSCGFCKIASRVERRKHAQAGARPFVSLNVPGVPR